MIVSLIKISVSLLAAVFLLFLAASLFFYLTQSPSNNKQWEFGQQKLQRVDIDGQQVTIKDLRDYDWFNSPNTENYRDMSFALSDVESVEVGVSHFSAHESIAHVFVVFAVKGQEDFGLSVEARRSVGKDFTITGGLTFAYDLAYFLTSKQDLLSIRKKRQERIYLFPTTTAPLVAQQLFEQLSIRVNQLAETPEFYHILFKNCATQVIAEVEKITELSFPFYEKTFAPGFSGKVLFDMGLIATENTDFEQIKKEFLVAF